MSLDNLDDSFKDIDVRTLELERETAALQGMTAQERAAHAEARDAQRFGAEREKEALQARQDQARETAIKILDAGNVRGYFLEVFQTQHTGDVDTAEGILIAVANQSILNSKGIQPAVYAESGAGKSHAARAMLHLFPKRFYMNAAISDKALFYLEADELKSGMIMFSDDAKISDGIEGIIKRSTTGFQEFTVYKVPSKDAGKWKTKDLTIPPRILWLLTSVDSQGSEQLINRQIGFGVDESTAQDDKVTAFELAKALSGQPEFTLTDDVLICREIILNIKEDATGEPRLFTVKIPFAKRVEWMDKRNRRNLPIFLDMIKGYAVLNFKKRETDDEGALIATEEDFKAAERLYNMRGGFQKLHIHEREKEMLQHLAAAGGELPTEDLMSKLKLSGTRIRAIAARLETVLPLFYVEKRSESVQDPTDKGKHTVTQRNYYCYTGEVTLDLFGSVVSLNPGDDNDGNQDQLNSTSIADKYQLNNHLNMGEFPLEKPKDGALTHKEDSSNNNNIINNNKKGSLEVNTEVYTHARVCSEAPCSSGLEDKPTEGDASSILSLEASEGIEAELQVLLKRPLSAIQVVDADTQKPGMRELADACMRMLQGLARSARKKGIYDEDMILKNISGAIKAQNPGLKDYDVYGFGKRLIQEDKEAQGLLADIVRS